MKKIILISIILIILFSVNSSSVRAEGATLKLEPPVGSFYIDSTFDITVVLDTGGNNINAVEISLKFPADKLQVAVPSTGKSFISIWTTPPSFSNTEGTIKFQGGLPTPGINTSRGIVSTITFRAKTPGEARIDFLPGSAVYLDDGLATNILSSIRGGVYTLNLPPPAGPKVFSSSHPDPDKWYRQSDVKFDWGKEEGVTDFSYIIDQSPTTIPDAISEEGSPSVYFEHLEDGIWYFHVRAKEKDKWGGTTTFLVRIDATPPAEPKIEIEPSAISTNKNLLISFFSTDNVSGIDYYQLKLIDVGGTENIEIQPFFIDVQSPYKASIPGLGIYNIIIRAYDGAGNSKDSIQKIEIMSPLISFLGAEGIKIAGYIVSWPIVFTPLVIILIILSIFFFRAWKKHGDIKARFYGDLSNMYSRLQKDMGEIDGKLKEDFTLKQRFKDELDAVGKVLFEKTQKKKNQEEKSSVNRHAPINKITFLLILITFISILLFTFSHLYAQVRAPVIETFPREIGSNERLYLAGKADSNVTIKIFINQKGQEPLVAETRSLESGEWNYLHDKFIQPGIYQIYAKAVDEKGEESEFGPQVSVNVISRAVELGGMVLSYEVIFGIAILVLIFISALLACLIFSFWVKTHRLRDRLIKEIYEAEEAVRKGFDILGRDIKKELELLTDAKFKERALSKKEESLRHRLIEDFEAIKTRIKKEVLDIEKQLK